jgi:hypothetical protein
MRLTREQKDMLRAFEKHTAGIAFIEWMAAPLLKAKYLRPVFSIEDEMYYGITRSGRAVIKPKRRLSGSKE